MAYVDGFLLAVPRNKRAEYEKAVAISAKVFKECGATDYVELMGDDVPHGELTSFPRAVMAKDDEFVVLSWVTYPSKEVRDAANKKVMSDQRMHDAMQGIDVDGKRMVFGGFVPIHGL